MLVGISENSTCAHDCALISKILSKPQEGWQEFEERYGRLIRSWVGHYHASPEDTEEIYQEICIRLVKKDYKLLRAWVPERCPLPGYLAVITTSVCLNFFRSSFHVYSIRKWTSTQVEENGDAWDLLSTLEDSAPSPRERLMRMEMLGRLEGLLQTWTETEEIPREDRLLLQFRLGGMSYRQMGKVLGISEQNAAVRFHRLKNRLKEHLTNPKPRQERALG
jgi:RNA polymerase sigma factor (sigma-70 family)